MGWIFRVPIGLPDVSSYPALFTALFETGRWTEEDLEKLSGRNLIRVFKEVERIRDKLQSASLPMQQDVIKRADVERANINTTCVTSRFIDDPTDLNINENKNSTSVGSNKIIPDENNSPANRNRRHLMSYEESGDLWISLGNTYFLTILYFSSNNLKILNK